MRWFEQQRLKWIGECLKSKGYVNRQDLIAKFGVTLPTASRDLNTFMRELPDLMQYNSSTKRYEIIGPFSLKDM